MPEGQVSGGGGGDGGRGRNSKSLEISVLGQKVVLRHSSSDPELVRRTVDLVTSKLEEAEKRGHGAAAFQVALLALMDLAAEYLQARDRTADFKRQVDEKSARIQSWIDTEFKP